MQNCNQLVRSVSLSLDPAMRPMSSAELRDWSQYTTLQYRSISQLTIMNMEKNAES